MKEPKPRVTSFYGMVCRPSHYGETWIEAEEATYPSGAMTRRARVRCEDGKLRVVRCGLPDTFFSIPVRGGGWIGMDEEKGELRFHGSKKTGNEN